MRMETNAENDHNTQLEGSVTNESEAHEHSSDPMEVDTESKEEKMEVQEQDNEPATSDKTEEIEPQKEEESTPADSERDTKETTTEEVPGSTEVTEESVPETSSNKNQSKEEEIVVTPDCGFFGLSQPGCSKDDQENEDDDKNWEDIDSDDDFPCFDNSAEIPETVEALKSALTATESLPVGEGVSEQAKKKASDAIKVAIKNMDDFELSGRTLEKIVREVIINLLQAAFDPNKCADAEADKLEERLKEEMKIRNGILNSIQNQFSECHAVLKVLFTERQRQKEKGNKISAVPRRILRNVGLQVSKTPLTDEERGIVPKKPIQPPRFPSRKVIATKTITAPPIMTQQIRRAIPLAGMRMRPPPPRLQPTRMSMLNSRMGPPPIVVRGQPMNRMPVPVGQNHQGRFSSPPSNLLLRNQNPNGATVMYRGKSEPIMMRGKAPQPPQMNSDEEFKRATAKKSTAPRRNPPPVFKKPQDVIVIDDD